MRFEKIKNIILRYCQFFGFMSAPTNQNNRDNQNNHEDNEKVASSQTSYPLEFLKNAQSLLNQGQLVSYGDLLAHNFQPPPTQREQWSQLLVAEISSGNHEVIKQLISKEYRFSEVELLNIFQQFSRKSYPNTREIGKYLNNHIDPAVPLILDWILKNIKKTNYSVEFEAQYPNISAAEVEKKANAIAPHLVQLQLIWQLIENNSKHHEKFIQILNTYSATLISNYSENIQKYKFFGAMDHMVKDLHSFKNEVMEKTINSVENKDKLSSMKEFLKEQHSGENVFKTAEELYQKTTKKTQKFEPHIQSLVEQISKIYKTVGQSSIHEIAFESKNVLEKTVPQLLSVYLSFPEEYRKTFKNDNNQTPEDLLIIGLTQQKDILQNFETMALKEKAKEMETLNLYGHNKKMSLGK